MRSLRSLTHRYWGAAAGALVLAAAAGLGAVARAQTDQGTVPGRVLLDGDLAKLGVVVMANQTPITRADAQAVLPVLEKIQADLEEQEPDGDGTDDAAADLDAQLRAALSPKLLAAVGAVRLLAPPVPRGPAGRGPGPGRRGHMRGPAGPGAGPGGAGADLPGPRMGRGPRGGRGPGGPMGPMGRWLLGPLLDFFKTTAAG